MKYKWTVHRTLEYINSKKLDIEMTKSIIKKLQKVEKLVEARVCINDGILRNDWHIDPKIQKSNKRSDQAVSEHSRNRLGNVFVM